MYSIFLTDHNWRVDRQSGFRSIFSITVTLEECKVYVAKIAHAIHTLLRCYRQPVCSGIGSKSIQGRLGGDQFRIRLSCTFGRLSESFAAGRAAESAPGLPSPTGRPCRPSRRHEIQRPARYATRYDRARLPGEVWRHSQPDRNPQQGRQRSQGCRGEAALQQDGRGTVDEPAGRRNRPGRTGQGGRRWTVGQYRRGDRRHAESPPRLLR